MFDTNISDLGQKLLCLLGVLVDPCLDLCKQLGASSLDHITEQRPGSTTESNQGHLTIELLACQCDGIINVAELNSNIDILGENLAVLSVIGTLERFGEVWALLVNHLDSHAHGLWDDQNIGKDYGSIYEACESADGLKGNFCCNFGVTAAFEKVSVALGFVVLGEVTASC